MKTTYYAVNTFEKYKELLDHLELYTNRGYEKATLINMWSAFKERTCIVHKVNEEGESVMAADIEWVRKKKLPYLVWTGKINKK